MNVQLFPDLFAALVAVRSSRMDAPLTGMVGAAADAASDGGKLFAIALPNIVGGTLIDVAMPKASTALRDAIAHQRDDYEGPVQGSAREILPRHRDTKGNCQRRNHRIRLKPGPFAVFNLFRSSTQHPVAPADAIVRALHYSSVIINGTCPNPHWMDPIDSWRRGGGSCCVVTVVGVEDCRQTISLLSKMFRYSLNT